MTLKVEAAVSLVNMTCVLYAILLGGCNYGPLPYQGRILYVDAGGITIVQLPSGKQRLLVKTTRPFAIYQSPRVESDSTVLLSDFHDELLKLNIDNGSLASIGHGYWPTYIGERAILFYWRDVVTKAGHQQSELHERILKSSQDQVVVSQSTYSRIIQKSPSSIMFYGNGDRIWEYDSDASLLQATKIYHCSPDAWRSAAGQLVCHDLSASKRYYVISSPTKVSRLPLPQENIGAVLSYVPRYDIMIYSAETGSLINLEADVWKLFAYHFNDRSVLPLGGVGPMASGTWLSN